jgi:hypothetical protein
MHLIVDRPHLAFSDLGLDQLLKQLVRLPERRRTLLGKLSYCAGHAMELHRLQRRHEDIS